MFIFSRHSRVALSIFAALRTLFPRAFKYRITQASLQNSACRQKHCQEQNNSKTANSRVRLKRLDEEQVCTNLALQNPETNSHVKSNLNIILLAQTKHTLLQANAARAGQFSAKETPTKRHNAPPQKSTHQAPP